MGGVGRGWSSQEIKEWEAVRTPRKGEKGWEDGAPRGGLKVGGRMWNSQVPPLEECVDLSSAPVGKQMHGMA